MAGFVHRLCDGLYASHLSHSHVFISIRRSSTYYHIHGLHDDLTGLRIIIMYQIRHIVHHAHQIRHIVSHVLRHFIPDKSDVLFDPLDCG